ncbi:MAG: FKBP-type peptidyl-prolyl cis-trans isomerase [Verrucomicrobiota bacterium]
MQTMNIGRKLAVISALTLCSLSAATMRAEDAAFKDDKEKASYSIGLFFGNQIKAMDVDLDVMLNAMKEVQAGKEPKLTQPQAREAIMAYQKAAQAKIAEKNLLAGTAFLKENKAKDGVQILPVKLPDGTIAEMQYKVVTEGTGATPGASDTVKVNYRGTLINGTEFDSSAKHGDQPAQFMVGNVIKGWTEALLKMKVGSKWQLFIPATLAYGEMPRPGIEPGSTLIFDVELLDTQAPAPAPEPTTLAPKPLTSDIIRVPSAEEMKQGAKIEVIKAADLEKTNSANKPK